MHEIEMTKIPSKPNGKRSQMPTNVKRAVSVCMCGQRRNTAGYLKTHNNLVYRISLLTRRKNIICVKIDCLAYGAHIHIWPFISIWNNRIKTITTSSIWIKPIFFLVAPSVIMCHYNSVFFCSLSVIFLGLVLFLSLSPSHSLTQSVSLP